ncbi:hypothetical protein ACQRBF_00455 [Peptoniphilaceae bacterium SGI.131]
MDRLKELKEAKAAAQKVIIMIDNTKSSLDSALSWGTWDIFAGGFFTSLIKRDEIKKANQYISEIAESLKILNEELKDIDMILPKDVSDNVYDNILDIWFDNIFTDIRVQEEIKDSLRQMATFKKSILKLISKLDEEIQMMENIK